MLNIIRTLCIIIFFGLLTACGGGGGGNTASAPTTPTPPTTMTVTMPDMPTTPTPPEPVVFPLNSENIGALRFIRANGRANPPYASEWMVFMSVAAEGENITLFGEEIPLRRRMVVLRQQNNVGDLPDFNRASLHMNRDLVPLVNSEGMTTTLSAEETAIAFQTQPTITAFIQLCPVTWINDYMSGIGLFFCPQSSPLSHSPDMRRVVYAVMADGFHRGFAFGESGFSFSGKYDGNNRAAGFTYDMGGYALRTDYIRLPSKQNGNIWLDTYRFGIIRPINDESRFFAGVDSYKNAILAIDKTVNNKNTHRLGIAAGNGYALKYEYRLNL